jgi:hypothetical protein
MLCFCAAVNGAPSRSVIPNPAGAALCEANGEGTHTTRYPTGVVKIRVVCRDTPGEALVRYGWYFDDKGRQIREEDLVPDDAAKSRITEHDYELSSVEPIATRVFDGNGNPIRSTEAEAAHKKVEGPSTFTDYRSICEGTPNDLLYPLMGSEKEPQFFTKNACTCVAEKAIQADQAAPSVVWKRTKTLDYRNPKHRASVAALGNLAECLCPDAFPESRLEKLCAHSVEIEKAWKP